MRWHAATLFFVVPLLAGAGGAGAQDAAKMQGTWVLTQAEDDGRTAPAEELAKLVWSFDGERYTIRYHNDVREGTFRLDPDKTPKAFDQTATAGADKGRSYRGIYRLVGDELVLCFPRDPKADRPTEFTGKAGSGQVLLVFKRRPR
jgi:uncharacterized protein (TIGR03067 family)